MKKPYRHEYTLKLHHAAFDNHDIPIKMISPALVTRMESSDELPMDFVRNELCRIMCKRPKGKWIKGDMFECDLCHHKMIVGDGAYNYCPHCGADMRGEE